MMHGGFGRRGGRLAAAALVLLSTQGLAAQPVEEEQAVSSEAENSADPVPGPTDDTSDDAVGVETGGDTVPDTIRLVDADGEPEWNEEDDFRDLDTNPPQPGEAVADGFRDVLPTVEQAAPVRPLGIVNRAFNGVMVLENQARFQAQIAYASSPRAWRPPSTVPLPAGNQDWELKHICGGALIDRDWVLTAAHCVSEAHFRRGMVVVLGAEDIAQPSDGMAIRVDRLIIHAGYTMYENDIALVHLATDGRPRSAAEISPIAPYTGPEPAAGSPVSGLGWGRTQQAGSAISYSAILWRADQRLIPVADCRQRAGYEPKRANGATVARIGDKVLCAGDTPSKTCSGDSGGPLIFTKGAPRLIGIVSWTKENCSNPANPGVYTRVSSFAGWIERAKAANPANGAVQRLGD